MKRAWYLGIAAEDVAPRCVLVGDPARVALFAERLDAPRLLSEERGLRTIGGGYQGTAVTVAAFGMGAPIAVVVLEELVGLGARVVLRAGTAMAVDAAAAPLGSFVIAQAALRGDGTSATYAPPGYPAAADPALNAATAAALEARGLPYRVGVLASYDGFYTEMLAADPARQPAVEARLAELRRLRVLAADMETSAVLVAGAVLGIRAGSLCLVSVDGASRGRLNDEARRQGERDLVELALAAVAGTPTG